MNVERISLSDALPFYDGTVRLHLRPDDDSPDVEVTRLAAAAARDMVHHGQLALLAQNLRVTLASWPDADDLPLPVGSLLASDDVAVTADALAFSGFTVLTGPRPSLHLTGDRPEGIIVVDYVAGFGADAAAIPPDLEVAIADQAGAFFDPRGQGDGKSDGLSPHAARIVGRYRRLRF